MKNKKLLIVLITLCIAFAIGILVLVLPKENTQLKPIQTETNNIQQRLPLIINMKEVGDISIERDNDKLFLDLSELLNQKIFLGETKENIFIENEYLKADILENSIIINDKHEDEEKETHVHEPRVIEIENTIIKKDNKIFLSEEVLKLLIQVAVTDRNISITNKLLESNKLNIDELLFSQEIEEITTENISEISNKIAQISDNYTSNVLSDFITKNVEITNIIKSITDGIIDEDIIYSGKVNNSYIIIFGENTANKIASDVLEGNVDHYLNIRMLINTDEAGSITDIKSDMYTTVNNQDLYTYITLKQK